MKKDLVYKLHDKFGDIVHSKKFDYDVKESDLYDIFAIINETVFHNKLSISELHIIVSNNTEVKDKGSFMLGVVKGRQKCVIRITKFESDNFYQIVNVLCHEMIHMYDFYFGPLNKYKNDFYVKNINGKQFIGDYDSHGSFFKKQMDRMNAYGLNVQIKYDINDKKYMKKISENDKFFENNVDEKLTRENVRRFYESFKNTKKNMVYKDSDNWYIEIS